MKLSRREFVLFGLGGLGACLTGCANQGSPGNQRPGPIWSGAIASPQNPANGNILNPPGHQPPARPGNNPTPPNKPAVADVGSVKAIPRAQWAQAGPITSRILPMNGVSMVTVHHEGWTPVWFSDYATTAKRLDSIRRAHLDRLGAGDIGYHLVIDRSGRVWQGRDLNYQGAHVKEHNPHNIGVMVLGNFDLQKPTDAQLSTLRATLISLRKNYRVPLKQVFTHQELNPTECPGDNLQGRVSNLRRSGLA